MSKGADFGDENPRASCKAKREGGGGGVVLNLTRDKKNWRIVWEPEGGRKEGQDESFY